MASKKKIIIWHPRKVANITVTSNETGIFYDDYIRLHHLKRVAHTVIRLAWSS